MELKAYIRIFRRWLWLIILLATLAGGISFIVNRTQPSQYQTSVTIQVGSAQYSQNPDTGLIQTSEQLADTYAVIVKKYPVLQATVTKLQLKITATDLARYFQVTIVPNTALLVITVTYPDPDMAANIANELGAELIANSPTDSALNQQSQIKTIQTEITDAQSVLDIARTDLSATDDKISKAQDAVPPELTTHRNDVITQINAAQANLAQLSATLITLQKEGSLNSLKFVENALIPDKPIGLSIVVSTLVAAFAGAAVAFGLAFLIEYLNDTVRNPAELAELTAQFGVKLLGSVTPFGKRNTYGDKLVTWLQPRSPIAEAYRKLRVGLMYAEKDNASHHHVYIVTSASPAEGKTVTAANLAVTFSTTGLRVLLIDADLRRPNQHNMFELNNLVGLSNALTNNGSRTPSKPANSTNNPTVDTASRTPSLTPTLEQNRMSLLTSTLLQKTEIPGLDIITSGLSPANPAELLGTVHMQEFVQQLSESEDYDVVIFDTPPALTVSDSYILANVAHASVLLIAQAGKTRRGTVIRTIQEFAQLSIPIAGIVLNRLNPHDADSGYSYYYNYYGYGGSKSVVSPEEKPDARPIPAINHDSPEQQQQ